MLENCMGGIMDNSDEKKAFEKKALRKLLIEQRLNLPDRLQRSDLLQRVMRIWLVKSLRTLIGFTQMFGLCIHMRVCVCVVPHA